MFSDNKQISGRQVYRLLVFDWIAKAGLLIPGFTNHADGRNGVVSLLLAVGAVFIYCGMTGNIAKHVEGGFWDYMVERIGPYTAWMVTLFYFFYVFVNTVFLLRLFAAIAIKYILPETSAEVLMAMVLLTAVYMAYGGIEIRARTAEILFGIILYPLMILLILGAGSMNEEYLSPGQTHLTIQTVKNSLKMFLTFGGMGVFLYILPYLKNKKEMGRLLRRAALTICGGVFGLFVVSIGAFGENGMRAVPWPAITLMSSVEIPGRFLQRWDVIFTALLLISLLMAAGAGLFYQKVLASVLIQKEKNWVLPAVTVFLYITAIWCETYETISHVFLVVNGYILVPILVFFTILFTVVEFVKEKG